MTKRRLRGIFGKTTILSSVTRVVSLALFLVSTQYISRFVVAAPGRNERETASYIIVFACILLFKLLWDAFLTSRVKKMSRKCQQTLIEEILTDVLNAGEDREKHAESSDYIVVLDRDVAQNVEYYTEVVPSVIQSIFGLLLYSAYFILFMRNLLGLVCILVLSVFQGIPPYLIKKYIVKNYAAAAEEEAVLQQHILSGISGFATYKRYALHDWFMGEYRNKQAKYQAAGMKGAAAASVQSSLYNMLSALLQLGLAVIMGMLSLNGLIPLDTAIQSYLLSTNLYSYVNSILLAQTNHRLRDEAVRRINQCITLRCAPDEAPRRAPSDASKLKLDHVTYAVHGETIIHNASLSIGDNGVWLIQGQNGVGKTTLLHLILGQLSANEGEILVNGANAYGSDLSGEIAYCPQSPLSMDMTAERLIALLPHVDADKLHHCFEVFDVAGRTQVPLHSLSGGEQKKIMLSLCFASKAPILLLDEPEVSLDAESIDRMIALLPDAEKLIILVSHTDLYTSKCKGAYVFRGNTLAFIPKREGMRCDAE